MIIDNLLKDKINRDKQSDKKDTKILKKGGQIMNKNLFKRVICLIIALMMVMPNMPKRFRLTRRFPVAMTEDGYRRLKKFAAEAGLDEGEALSFLFEHFDSVINQDTFSHRLRLFNSELDARKR